MPLTVTVLDVGQGQCIAALGGGGTVVVDCGGQRVCVVNLQGRVGMDYIPSDPFAAADWLLKNGWKYGFVFRFPVEGYPNETVIDKSYKTGVSSKLMIYRYVGEGHAAAMKQLDMCMEEYIEYLMAHPHIAVYEDGNLKYEITRVNADTTNGAKVELSGNAKDFSVSMDNCGGVIVCMSY